MRSTLPAFRVSDWSGTPQRGNPREEYSPGLLAGVNSKRDPAAFGPGHAQSNTNQKGRLNTKTGQYVFGYAKHLRDALPNASFIGFTGTPIERDDKDTRGVFGDHVSIYDIQDAVDDKATVPIYYESRLARGCLKSAFGSERGEFGDQTRRADRSIASSYVTVRATKYGRQRPSRSPKGILETASRLDINSAAIEQLNQDVEEVLAGEFNSG